MTSYNLSIPPFQDSMFRYTNNPEKSGHQNVLVNARTTSKKCKQNKETYTIHEKLTDIYLEHAEKKNIQHWPFMKCNFVEELVLKKKLKYITLAIFPNQRYFFYAMEEHDNTPQFFFSVEKNERKCLVDALDNEEIPIFIFDLLRERSAFPYLLCDYHLILHIQKFAIIEENTKKSIFSTFLLLKPVITMCREFGRQESISSRRKDNDREQIKPEDYESTVFSKMAGPLHLYQKDKRALQLIFLLEFYSHPFASNKLKLIIMNGPQNILPVKPRKGISPFSEPKMTQFFEEEFKALPLHFDRLRESLRSILSKREILMDDSKVDSNYCANLVEIFYFKTKMDGNGNHTQKEEIYELNVYWKNGIFYTNLKYQKYVRCPSDSKIMNLVGGREKLDQYIFKFAEITSDKFGKYMRIQHKNMIEKQIKDIFTCESLEDMVIEKTKSFNMNNGSCRDLGSENHLKIPASEDKGFYSSSESQVISQTRFMHGQTRKAESSEFQQGMHKRPKILFAQSGTE